MNNPLETPIPGDTCAPGQSPVPMEAPQELTADVCVYVGGERIAKYSIIHGEYLIGRDPSCPVFVEADQVSRHHARVTFSAFDLVIEDLGSSNGVFIDGVQVQLPTLIRFDQEVQIGTATLHIRLGSAATKQLAESLWDEDLGMDQVREQIAGRKYRFIANVNSGGMGVILQVRDLRIRRTVAMKVMKSSSQFSRENVLRFIDEAQLTGQLEHPNIVPVYELGLDDQSRIFYTMKFVKGTTLDDVICGIRKGDPDILRKYPLGALLTIFQKVCDGVAFAHARGVIHRDLKPANIMIGAFGEVLVMDWGLAKNTTGDRRESKPIQLRDSAISDAMGDDFRGFQTMHGLIVGTPPYISPEQARGELDKIDGRSDIYVLGGILYIILTLRPPVDGDTEEVAELIANNKILPPVSYNNTGKKASQSVRNGAPEATDPQSIVMAHCPGKRVPDGLSAVVMKALSLEPGDRYQTVEELQEEIAAYQGGFAPKAENASVGKQILLFAGRHKFEVTLFGVFAVIFHILVVGFFLQITEARDKALEQERITTELVKKLRGTAPTFAKEANELMNDQDFGSALDKIDYAIQQVPNDANYHNLRGDILQGQLRLQEAVEAYEETLRINPNHENAKASLEFTQNILKQIGNDSEIKPEIIDHLSKWLKKRDRDSAAMNVRGQSLSDRPPRDPDGPGRNLRTLLEKRNQPSAQASSAAPNTTVDFTRIEQPDFRRLQNSGVTALILDDTKIVDADLNNIKGLPLKTLSLSRTVISDLTPLIGMPIENLVLDNCPVTDLSPLEKLPLKILRFNNSRATNLAPLRSTKIESLSLSGGRAIKDISGLRGLPLRRLILSYTVVSDLSPLTQSPLRELDLKNCQNLNDLRPLMSIPTLENVVIPAQCTDIEYLRSHRGIKYISYTKMNEPAAEFWAAFDAKKAVKPAAATPPPAPATPARSTPTAPARTAPVIPPAPQIPR